MFGDMKKMAGMMKQLGIRQEEIDAKRVIIEKDNGKIVIDNPNVSKIKFQGQETWQIVGEGKEEQGISEDDIKTVMEKTGKTKKEAEKALKESNGDLAEAILSLS